MKKQAFKATLFFIAVPTILVFVSNFMLQKYTDFENFRYIYLLKDFFILIVSGIIAYRIIIDNNTRNSKIFEKIKKNNEDIRVTKERYDIVAKATSDTIWDWNIHENKFYWNKGIFGIFGFDKKDVIKNLDWLLENIHPADLNYVKNNLEQIKESKAERWKIEYRFKCNDGSYKNISERGFLILDKNKKPFRMIGSMEDVTKQYLEKQQLKLLETVITNMKDAVLITDHDTSELQIPKIIFVNEAFTNMSGYTSQEIVGQSPMIFIGKNSSKTEFEKLTTAIKNKTECIIETPTYKKNGDEYWVKFSMIPIFNKKNTLTHWISIQRDITQRKINDKEKELLISELSQSNTDLRQFSYITSHNLRSPLSNLIGLLKFTENIEIENDELKLILDGFSKSTYLLDETISDLGKVLNIKENRSKEKENVSIQDTLSRVFTNVNVLISRHKPKFILNIATNQFVYANKLYFESIILNLLTNAIKYRSTDRQLEIEIKSDEIDNNIILTFEDNGIGINLDLYGEKIFGLYQKFHNYTDSKGLGLYIVKSQVESIGGTIEVESKVNVGTKFILKFKKQ